MVEIRKIEEVWGGVDIPEITGVYDPLSGLRDGTITSQAPIVVSGYNLNRYALENIRLCLVTHAKPEQVIDIRLVYRYSEGKVVVALPELKPGEYRPAVILKGDEKKVYWLSSSLVLALPPKTERKVQIGRASCRERV